MPCGDALGADQGSDSRACHLVIGANTAARRTGDDSCVPAPRGPPGRLRARAGTGFRGSVSAPPRRGEVIRISPPGPSVPGRRHSRGTVVVAPVGSQRCRTQPCSCSNRSGNWSIEESASDFFVEVERLFAREYSEQGLTPFQDIGDTTTSPPRPMALLFVVFCLLWPLWI